MGTESLNGLTLLLNLSSEDYFYPLRNFIGAVIFVFNSDEFPDASTGSVSEVLVGRGDEVLIALNAMSLEAQPDVQRYSFLQVNSKFT